MLVGSSNGNTSCSTSSSPLNVMSSTKIFPCNTCDLVFESSQAQRTHMREPWHVYNLKRRIADLPPISADDYTENVATSLVSSKQEPLNVTTPSALVRTIPGDEPAERSDESEDLNDEQAQINRCLFCTRDLDSLETNLEHMSAEHGLFIPEIEHLSSLETILGYLHTVITEYNECLYCGIIKQSTEGVRRHMLDKGHCMINLEREPELLEFWELSDGDAHDTDDEEIPKSQTQKTDMVAFKDSSQDEYTLPSGKVLGSKSKARDVRRLARRTALAAKETSSRMIIKDSTNSTAFASANPAEPPTRTQRENQDRSIALRDAAGLVGVSDQQMRSLITVHRKMQRQQAIVRASAVWADEKGGTHQKHYKQKMNLRDG